MAYTQKTIDLVRRARTEDNLTIAELSKKFNIAKTTIHSWIRDLPKITRTKSGNSWKNNPWKIISDYYHENDVVLSDCLKKFTTLTKHAIDKAIKEGVLQKKTLSKTMEILHKTGRHPGWTFNGRAGRSYPEEFLRRRLVESGLYSKYTIVEKFSFSPYWFDFALIDYKIDIEIDGQQHFITNKAIEHDKKRDKYAESHGWRVYRIAWKEFSTNSTKILSDLVKFIEDVSIVSKKYSIEEVKSLYKTPKRKYSSRAEYFAIDKQRRLKEYADKIELIKTSDINFSNFGWVKKVANLINKKPQKINKWMRSYVPEIYKDAFKRKPRIKNN